MIELLSNAPTHIEKNSTQCLFVIGCFFFDLLIILLAFLKKDIVSYRKK